jgi:hypothetical protein
MLWVFLIVGMTGILCGSLCRAPALIILSFISFSWAFIVLPLNGYSLGEALVTAFLITAVLQMGYLLGAGCGNLWQYLRPHILFYGRDGFRGFGISQRSRRWLIPHG